MSERTVRLSTESTVGGTASHIAWSSDRTKSAIVLEQSALLPRTGRHTEAAEDLLAIAIAAYCADRTILRDTSRDAWTRDIHLEVPVHVPGRWDVPLLERTISFLTGDNWRITLRQGPPNPGLGTTSASAFAPELFALFSGGVDSLTGTHEARAASATVGLVSYFGDGPTSKLQQSLSTTLSADHHRFRLITTPATTLHFGESSTRSRSFLFLALAILVARCNDVHVISMAENGFIAINVPLHAGRIGSLSTRTAHPHYVTSLNRLLAGAGVGAAVRNPYLTLTKGEVTDRLRDHAPDDIATTISCAHPIGRWAGQGFRNCGYCYPCMIRQAGIHHGGDDPTTYAEDPFGDITFYARHRHAASDIKSVARALLDTPTIGDVLATGPIGSYGLATELHDMRVRGVGELKALFDDRLTPRVRRELGL